MPFFFARLGELNTVERLFHLSSGMVSSDFCSLMEGLSNLSASFAFVEHVFSTLELFIARSEIDTEQIKWKTS